MICIRIYDARSLGSWCIKGTAKSHLNKESSGIFNAHDPKILGINPDPDHTEGTNPKIYYPPVSRMGGHTKVRKGVMCKSQLREDQGHVNTVKE